MNDLPAIFHDDHDGPTEHNHEGMGPAHYMHPSGHFHLTKMTQEEIDDALGVTEDVR